MTLGLCVGSLIIFGLSIPTHAKSVGQASCGNTIEGYLGKTPITKAILESSTTGYLFRFTWKNSQHIWILNPNLAITEAYTLDSKAPDGKGIWNIFGDNIVKINSDGSFNIAMMVSSRSGCEFKGKLTFAKGTKEQLFNSNSTKKRSALPEPYNQISTTANAVPIRNGFYFQSPPNDYEGIEVNNKRFRFVYEGSDPTDPVDPWKGISQLKSIKKGVILHKNIYFCSKEFYPNNKYCTRNGGKGRHS